MKLCTHIVLHREAPTFRERGKEEEEKRKKSQHFIDFFLTPFSLCQELSLGCEKAPMGM